MTSEIKQVVLPDRGIVAVNGSDATKLLQGLVTNDVALLDTQPAIYAGLLSPQGKILFDFIVVKTPDGALIDVAKDQAAALVKRLTMYKLRAAVTITDVSADHTVVAAFGPDAQFGQGIVYSDPRLPDLGLRAIVETKDAVAVNSEASAYHAFRIGLGVPEGGRDYAFGDAFPHEALFDQLHGVSFTKGCYVGQEIVSRMEHRGTARKRIVPVDADGPACRGRRCHGGRRGDRQTWIGGRIAWACTAAARPGGRVRSEGRAVDGGGRADHCFNPGMGALQEAGRSLLTQEPAMAKTPAMDRCPWAGTDPLYVQYHDEEWGVPHADERRLFEKLILEGFQAGLSWITILRKREAFRRAFHTFDPERIVRYGEKDVARLMADAGIVRNKLKIEATIDNARAYLKLRDRTTLAAFLWSQMENGPILNRFASMKELPAETVESKRISKALKAEGFRFVGPTTIYAYMQSVGLVNDHLITCPRHAAVCKLHRSFERPQ